MARDSKSGFSRKWSAFFALVIIVGGMAVSLGFAVRLRAALERNAAKRMITTSQALRTTVATQLDGYLDTVRSTAAGLGALPAPTQDTFTKITSAVAAQKLTAVSAVSFLIPAGPKELSQVVPTWRARGAADLKISPLEGAQQHLFTIFTRGLNGGKAPATGVDQTAAPAEVEVTRLARTSGNVAISDAYVLLADRDRPKAEQQLSFDVLAPVRTGARNTLIGYASLSIRGTDFLTANLSTAAGDLLDVDLLTRSGSGALTEVATVSGGRSQDVRRAETFEAGQRQWVLQTTASNSDLLPTAGRTDMAVLLAGSVLSVMFGTLLYLQMSATARADQEIELEVAERLAAYGLSVAGTLKIPPTTEAGGLPAVEVAPEQWAAPEPEPTPPATEQPTNPTRDQAPPDEIVTPADAAQPGSAQLDPAPPDAAQQDRAQPDAAQPDPAQVDPAQTGAAQTGAEGPSAVEPGVELAIVEAPGALVPVPLGESLGARTGSGEPPAEQEISGGDGRNDEQPNEAASSLLNRAKASSVYIGDANGEISLTWPTNAAQNDAEPAAGHPVGTAKKPAAKRASRAARTKAADTQRPKPSAAETETADAPQPKPSTARARRPRKAAPAKSPAAETTPVGPTPSDAQ